MQAGLQMTSSGSGTYYAVYVSGSNYCTIQSIPNSHSYSPGDAVEFSITKSSTTTTISVQDLTKGYAADTVSFSNPTSWSQNRFQIMIESTADTISIGSTSWSSSAIEDPSGFWDWVQSNTNISIPGQYGDGCTQ